MTTANDAQYQKHMEALESAVQGDAIFSVSVPSSVLRYMFAQLKAAETVIENVYKYSNQPHVIAMTRAYLNGENDDR